MLPLYKGNGDFNQPQSSSPGLCLVRTATVREPGPTPDEGAARKLGVVAGWLGLPAVRGPGISGSFCAHTHTQKNKEKKKKGYLSSQGS